MVNKLVDEYQEYIDKVKIEKESESLNEVVIPLILLGIATYKRYMSRAAKECKNLKFGEKTRCMQKYESEAVRAEISTLKSNLNKCEKEKKPSLCRAKVDKRLISLEDKLKKINLKLAKSRLKSLAKK